MTLEHCCTHSRPFVFFLPKVMVVVARAAAEATFFVYLILSTSNPLFLVRSSVILSNNVHPRTGGGGDLRRRVSKLNKKNRKKNKYSIQNHKKKKEKMLAVECFPNTDPACTKRYRPTNTREYVHPISIDLEKSAVYPGGVKTCSKIHPKKKKTTTVALQQCVL